MRIDYPEAEQIPQLKRLWMEAFGDSEEFLSRFFDGVFSPDRCRCVTEKDGVAAALYWFDCQAEGRPLAYLYAVATVKKHRGKGLCRSLMENTHSLLAELGYAGSILVPEGQGLFRMYRGMGYEICSAIREFTCQPGTAPVPLREISPEEYARLRRELLPPGGVIQENENLVYLTQQAQLYAGEDFLFCGSLHGGKLYCPELLGNADAAPGILAALGGASGVFHTPGEGRDFAMYRPLSDAPAPTYFGLAFD